MEAGAGSFNMGFPPRRPGYSAIIGEAFSYAVKGSHQHPKGSVLFFNEHMLIEAPVGYVSMTAQGNMLSLICRYVDIGELLSLQAMTFGRKRTAFIPPDRAGKQPFPL